MTTEVRIYTMRPGKFDEWVDVFQTRVMPTAERYGVRIHAAWLHREKNELIWIRSYDPEARMAYEASPERAAYTPTARECIESAEIRVVETLFRENSTP